VTRNILHLDTRPIVVVVVVVVM